METTHGVVKFDLEYTVRHWSKSSFDLWEEVQEKSNFFTRMVQRAALIVGGTLARDLGDRVAATRYEQEAKKIEPEIDVHWDATRNYIVIGRGYEDGIKYKESGLDSAVVLAVNHCDSLDLDDFFGVLDDRVIATVHAIRSRFHQLYPINHEGLPGTLIGRYPEDRYNGYHSNDLGNPWVLTTLAYAEYYFRLVNRLSARGTLKLTALNLPFFSALYSVQPPAFFEGQTLVKGTASFTELLTRLRLAGDQFLYRIRIHAGPAGALDEQMHRRTGFQTGAKDLTWSYVSFLTAIDERERAFRIPTLSHESLLPRTCAGDVARVAVFVKAKAG